MAERDHTEIEQTRPIEGLLDPHPVITAGQLNLARWMSKYYRTSLIECLTLMLPSGPEPASRLALPLARSRGAGHFPRPAGHPAVDQTPRGFARPATGACAASPALAAGRRSPGTPGDTFCARQSSIFPGFSPNWFDRLAWRVRHLPPGNGLPRSGDPRQRHINAGSA